MTDLHDQLTVLADRGVAPAGPPDPDDAWRRGRSWQRRRRATRAAAGVLALAVVGGAGVLARPSLDGEVRPMGGSGGLHLPDRVFDAPGWLDDDSQHPIGPLALALGGVREHVLGNSEMAVVGVSATTGEYRFLDLPDRAGDGTGSTVALSADGRWVAYWTTGDTPLEANRFDGSPATGLGLYDTVTGELRVTSLDAPHGAQVGDLGFAGDTLVAPVWTWDAGGTGDGAGSATYDETLLWEVARDTTVPATWSRAPDLYAATVHDDDVVTAQGRRVVATSAEGIRRLGRLSRAAQGAVALDPAGQRVALIAEQRQGGTLVDDGRPDPVLIAGLDGGPVARVGVRAWEVVGWRDDTHVVVRAPWDDDHPDAYLSVDTATGEVTLLTLNAPSRLAPGTLLAADALAAPTYAAVEPHARDPRLVAGGAVGLVLLAGAAIALGRRRGRV